MTPVSPIISYSQLTPTTCRTCAFGKSVLLNKSGTGNKCMGSLPQNARLGVTRTPCTLLQAKPPQTFVNIVPPWIAKRPTAQPQVVQPQAPQQLQPVMSYPQPVFYTDPVEQRRAMGIDFSKEMPWLTDKAIQTALSELRSLTFSPDDLRYLQSMGVETPFKSGKECVDFIEKENIRILFDKPAQNDVHAQYEFLKNTVTINDRYKGTTDFAIMLAIAEAILHEAGHAKDKDSDSSIQEELNFLGMNAVAHRAFIKKYGDIFSDTKEPIVNDGVSLYAKLFFEPDPYKRNLVNRIKEKYGDLPAGDRLHPPGKIARAAKSA